jgi:hypothetical protein
MRHLGVLEGSGTLESGGHSLGRADYEFDGYLVGPGQVVASGEVHMPSIVLQEAFGRTDLVLQTDDGQSLPLRFSGKVLAQTADVAHADIREGLPPPAKWRRRNA